MRLTNGLACGVDSAKQSSSKPLLQNRRVLLSQGGPILYPSRRQGICFARGEAQVNAPPSSASSPLSGVQREGRLPTSSPSAISDVPEICALGEGGLSWDDWVQHFLEMDAWSNSHEELKIRLQDAVRCERYGEAARLKQELLKVEAKDVVANVQSSMEEALIGERYNDAAHIRDEGLASMQGWWSGCAEDDPVGHLLHVKAEYGRWTGRVYRARDLEDIYLRRGNPLRSPSPVSPSRSSRTVGSPIMEVFLKPATGSGSATGAMKLMHQAVSLRVPTMDEIQARKLVSSLEETAYESDGEDRTTGSAARPTSPASVVRLSVSVGEDGTTSIKAQLPQPKVSTPSSSSDTAQGDVLKNMVTKALGISSDSVEIQMVEDSSSMDEDSMLNQQENSLPRGMGDLSTDMGRLEDEMLAGHLKSWRREGSGTDSPNAGPLPMSDEMIDITAAMSSLDWEDGAGSDLPPYARPGVSRNRVSDLADDLASEDAFSELTRIPAKLEMVGRDSFVFEVMEEAAHRRGSSSTSYPTAAAPPRGQASSSSASSSFFDLNFKIPQSSSDEEDGSGSGSVSGPNPNSSESSFDVDIPVSRLLKQRSPASASSLSAAFDQLAEHVVALQEARVGRSVPRQALSDAMREITTRLVSGKQVSNVTMMHIGLPDVADVQPLSSAPASLPSPAPKSLSADVASRFMYSRVPVNQTSTDPFDGLYLGAFGPHGAEMLRLSRTTQDGEEAVSAVKITGDANVPMNQVSFRAKIGRKYRLDTKDVYPDQLGVVARYKGEGRVAQRGFRNARWVEGELLVFSSSGTPLTGNAELGFVWAVPGEKRFLILLNKVNLKDCEK